MRFLHTIKCQCTDISLGNQDLENPADVRTYKYSRLLFSIIKITIVNKHTKPVWRSGYAVDCRSTTPRFNSGRWLCTEKGDTP